MRVELAVGRLVSKEGRDLERVKLKEHKVTTTLKISIEGILHLRASRAVDKALRGEGIRGIGSLGESLLPRGASRDVVNARHITPL